MKKKRNRIKKVIVLIAIFMMNGLGFMNAVYATSIHAANIYTIGDCGTLLKYRGIVVKTAYAQYSKEGVAYPAYCLDKTKQRSRKYIAKL